MKQKKGANARRAHQTGRPCEKACGPRNVTRRLTIGSTEKLKHSGKTFK